MDIVKNFKRHYIDTYQLTRNLDINSEAAIDQVIDNIDKMIAMLPFGFPDELLDEGVLIVNLADADDESKEALTENMHSLNKAHLLMQLNDWKFLNLAKATDYSENPEIQNKYRPLVMQQIIYCLTTFPDDAKDIWLIWLQLKYIDQTRDRLSLVPGGKNEPYTMSDVPGDFKTDAEYAAWLIVELEKLAAS